jgi:predicted DNA-binding antitoxin AbrB/MazE fold protein
MSGLEVEAVYEHGTLRLDRELPLAEGQKVTVTIYPAGCAVQRIYGSVPWPGNPEELQRFLDDQDERR